VALPLRSLTPAAPDPILGLMETFKADGRLEKVNLSVGVYVDDSGVTPVIPSVLNAERRLVEKAGSKGYLPIDAGLASRQRFATSSSAATTRSSPAGRSATAQTRAAPAPCAWRPTFCSKPALRRRSG